MIIKEIRNLTHRKFEELHNKYVSTFPLESSKQIDMFINHTNKILQYDNRHSLLYVFEYLRMALLDYMMVISNFQRHAMGRGILLEVSKENVVDPDEKLRRKKRIQFYSKLGVKVLDEVNYLLPIEKGDIEEST